jgi:iron complex transport system substrate-binding protein
MMTKTIETPGILLPPQIVDDLTRREFLVGAGLILLAPACGSGDEEGASGSGETRTIEHALGTTKVPVSPKRIVAVDGFALDTLFSLKVEPVGAVVPSVLPAYLRERVEAMEDVEGVGTIGEPNLENIAALGPDLILGVEVNVEGVYNELSEIAPTVVPAFESSADWKGVHLKFSEALGMEEEGRAVLEEYESRARELGESFDGRPPEISILRASKEYLAVYKGDSFVGTVVLDAGFSFPESVDDFEFEISRELLSELDADAIFVWAYEGTDRDSERELVNDLLEDPLFRRLDAAKRGDVYVVGDHWIGSGTLAANLVLDDLEEHLLDGETD